MPVKKPAAPAAPQPIDTKATKATKATPVAPQPIATKATKATKAPVAPQPIATKATPVAPQPIATKSDYICLLGEIHFPVKIPVSVADRYVVEAETPVTKANVIYISDLNNEERTIILNQDGYNHPILRSDLPSIYASLTGSKAKYNFEVIEPDREDGSDLAHYGHDAFLKISSFVGASPVRNQRYSKTMAYFRAVVR